MLERDQNILDFYLKARRYSEFKRELRCFWFILGDYSANQKKKITFSPVIKQFFCMGHTTKMNVSEDQCKF